MASLEEPTPEIPRAADGAPDIAPAPPSTTSFHAYRLFAAVVAIYAVAITVLAAFGVVGFMLKSLVVPSVVLVAILLRRFKIFAEDWAIFVAAMFFFDAIRGAIYSLITAFELPAYMAYAIDWEQALFGTPVLPHRLQAWWFSGQVGPLETFLSIVYASHFLVFLFFGLLLWMVRKPAFFAYTKAVAVVMVVGLFGYLLVPTIPPWMAADKYHVIPNVVSITGLVYNTRLPDVVAVFDVNPIAAMPSMHVAFPFVISFIAWNCFRLRSLPVLIYTALVLFSVVYLGQHYLVDAIAGVAVAAVGYFVGYKWLGRRRWLPHRSDDVTPSTHPNPLRLRLTVAGLLFGARFVLSLWSFDIQKPGHESEAFIARELEGKSDMVDYFRGTVAMDNGDTVGAVGLLQKALTTVPERNLGLVYVALGNAAFQIGDFASADAAFSRMREMPEESAWYWIQAKLKLGQVRAALPLVRRLAAQQPSDHPVHALEIELIRALPPEAFGEVSAASALPPP